MRKEKKQKKKPVKIQRNSAKKPKQRKKAMVARRDITLADVGHAMVNTAGRYAHNFVAQIAGRGEYKINKNTLWAGQTPSFRNNQVGTDIIHREFIRDVQGSTAFSLFTLHLNPGLQATFPWLSQVAGAFEEYEFMGMVFEFKTTSGAAVSSTNTALGTVVMATNYDVLDSNFLNKNAMEAYEYSTSTVPSANMYHPIECDPRQNVMARRYVRNNVSEPDSDLRFHDHGKFQLGVVGMQQTNVVGELWVSYHVRLYKPKLETALTNVSGWSHHAELPAATATSTSILGATGPQQVANTIGTQISYAPGTGPVNIVLPITGIYMILVATSETATATSPSLTVPTTSVNIIPYGVLYGNTASTSAAGVAASSLCVRFVIVSNPLNSPDITNTVVYTPRTGTYTNGRTDIFVFAMNEQFQLAMVNQSVEDRLAMLECMLSRLPLQDRQVDDDNCSVTSIGSYASSVGGRRFNYFSK